MPAPSPDRRGAAGAAKGRAVGGPGEAAAAAQAELADLEREMNRLRRSIRMAIQRRLRRWAGRSLGTLADNRRLARAIHELLDAHGLRVRCNECGHPAILRVSPRKGSAAGAFVFDHSIDGRRTFHGGAGVMPEVKLVAKPPRQPAARAVG